MSYIEHLGVQVADDGTVTIAHSGLSESVTLKPGEDYRVQFRVEGIEVEDQVTYVAHWEGEPSQESADALDQIVAAIGPEVWAEHERANERIPEIAKQHMEGERCQSCGQRYETVWAAENEMWNAVIGGPAGTRCPECFDLEAREAGFSPYWGCADGHFPIPENHPTPPAPLNTSKEEG